MVSSDRAVLTVSNTSLAEQLTEHIERYLKCCASGIQRCRLIEHVGHICTAAALTNVCIDCLHSSMTQHMYFTEPRHKCCIALHGSGAAQRVDVILNTAKCECCVTALAQAVKSSNMVKCRT
jgi:hypothetical protein